MKNFLIGLATIVLFPVWGPLTLVFLIGWAIAVIGSNSREVHGDWRRDRIRRALDRCP